MNFSKLKLFIKWDQICFNFHYVGLLCFSRMSIVLIFRNLKIMSFHDLEFNTIFLEYFFFYWIRCRFLKHSWTRFFFNFHPNFRCFLSSKCYLVNCLELQFFPEFSRLWVVQIFPEIKKFPNYHDIWFFLNFPELKCFSTATISILSAFLREKNMV